MGIYLNPGYENFRRILAGDIYVDKTNMLAVTNSFIDKGNNYICISRPRRFGKTIAGEMLSAYYSKGCDSRELFKDLKIAADPCFEEKLNKYNVIKLDINSEYQNKEDKDNLIKRLTGEIKSEIVDAFPEVNIKDDDSMAESILRVYAATGETFIIIMDEYDVMVREQVPEKLFAEYLSLLNGLFKSATLRPAISLAYLTGILPVVRDKIQSKLNNFEEYTIFDADKLAEYMGFTRNEVEELCDKYGMSFEECRNWYDGYELNGYELYSPESVVKSMIKGKYGRYWGKTSSYKVITDRLAQNFRGIKDDVISMLAGEEVYVDIYSYLNTMTDFETKNDVFTYLIHLGYLAYNEEEQTCRIPNKEVRLEWISAIAASRDYEVTDEIIQSSKKLLEATIEGDEDAVAAALDKSHIHVTSNRSYNNEDGLASAVYLAYIYALNEYTVVKEMSAGKGFADVVFVPIKQGKPAMIVELKRNKCAESALDQIRNKQYFEALNAYQGDLLFVGVNYDEKEKTHECRIERFVK